MATLETRIDKLEKPFNKVPPVLFVSDKNEIEQAKIDWQAEQKRIIGKDEKVYILIDNISPDPSEAQTILDYEARRAAIRRNSN
jgi:hypothetical protein